MNRLAIHDRTSDGPAPRYGPFVDIHRHRTVVRSEREQFTVPQEENCIEAIAQMTYRLDQRVEYRQQIKGGAADDLEHVRCRSLLLQRFGQFLSARMHFAEQPRI